MDVTIPNGFMIFSYWVHLLATVVWLGGLAAFAVLALPAWRAQTLDDNQWVALQKRFTPYVNASMALLWISGFIQMTGDVNYNGFLAFDSTWAWAMLLKHVAVVAMTCLSIYIQWRLQPQMDRVELLRQSRPKVAAAERAALTAREIALLRVNLVCAALVLFFTAVATAV